MRIALIAYDLFMLVGAALITSGVFVTWGMGPGLMASGSLVIGLTFVGARR